MARILIVAKQSKYEYERKKFELSHEEIIAKYSAERANLEAILQSHDGQLKTRLTLQELLPDARLIMMDQLKEQILDYDMVISLGGDNSFIYVTHFIGNIPILGINSDPRRSTGALCAVTANSIERVAKSIQNEKFRIENWTRLQATIDGKLITPATSEYFFGEKLRKDMSRHILIYRGKEYEQKSSGIIIATGAGSTGWYDSANRFSWPGGDRFDKTEQKAAFIVTEPYRYVALPSDVHASYILAGEELILHSLNDGDGYATADSWEEFDFSRGRKAVIRISDKPLKIIIP